ncbi:MAG: hypothetical protein ACKFI0_00320 [Candidatus Hodgkinia cicadicola]
MPTASESGKLEAVGLDKYTLQRLILLSKTKAFLSESRTRKLLDLKLIWKHHTKSNLLSFHTSERLPQSIKATSWAPVEHSMLSTLSPSLLTSVEDSDGIAAITHS